MPATVDFWTALPIGAVSFDPMYRQELSRQAGGTSRAADLGAELWTAQVSCPVVTASELRKIKALRHGFDGAIGTFLAWDARFPGPLLDPNGTILGAATPSLFNVGGALDRTAIQGLPVGYQLRTGDYFSYTVGTTPVHHCLHILQEDGNANGAGQTPQMIVRPRLRPGTVAGLAVKLIKATAEMFILSGTWDARTTKPPLSSVSFSALQVP